MAVTVEQVRAHLDPEEPNYRAAAAALGPEALPILDRIVRGADPMLASKAAYLASLMDDPGAAGVLQAAAHNPDPVVRVAAAAGVRNRPEPAATNVLVDLLTDRDPGVRSTALESVPDDAGDAVREAVVGLVRSEAEPSVRECSRRALDRLDHAVRQRRAGRTPAAGFTTPGEEVGGSSHAEPEGRGVGGGSLDPAGSARADDISGTGMGGGDLGPRASGDEGPFGGGSGD